MVFKMLHSRMKLGDMENDNDVEDDDDASGE